MTALRNFRVPKWHGDPQALSLTRAQARDWWWGTGGGRRSGPARIELEINMGNLIGYLGQRTPHLKRVIDVNHKCVAAVTIAPGGERDSTSSMQHVAESALSEWALMWHRRNPTSQPSTSRCR